MAKHRVYEVAREFDLSSEALVNLLREMGVAVKSHMSSIEDDAVVRVRERFARDKAAMKERDEKKQALAEERKKAPVGRPPAPAAEKPATPAPRTVGEKAPSAPPHGTAIAGARTGIRPPSRPGAGPRASGGKPGAGRPAAVKPGGPARKKGKGGRRRHRKVDQKEIEANIRKTLSIIEGKGRRRKKKRDAPAEAVVAKETPANVVRVSEFVSVSELAGILNVSPTRVIAVCMEMGLMVTINQRLDFDTIQLVCEEFDFHAELLEEYGQDQIDASEERPEDLEPRPPIVTVMGHVDHGKTSLLDCIRKTNVIAGERGGITQHVGAYEVELSQGPVTFLDTPGHEAFTAMRARGAKVTDIVVLVVAADDRVMPQTIEAIDHAKAAGVPIVVAINKVDLPTANADRVKQDLTNHGVVVEEYGGSTLCAEVSAKEGTGIDHLLELVLLQAEILELKASRKGPAHGIVVESRLDRGMGPVATVLVTQGTLKAGENFICGLYAGKVRALFNERGQHVKVAGPAQPVQVLGFDGVCQAGDNFIVMKDERGTKAISSVRQRLKREHGFRRQTTTLDDLYDQIKRGEVKTLRLIIKGDVDGSVEALTDSLQKLGTDEVGVEVIHRGVGAITETDILLAAASDAVVVGFHVKPDLGARTIIAKENVDVRIYQVIYEAVSDVRDALEGMLTPGKREIPIGTAVVREVFSVPRVGLIAGSFVEEGVARKDANVRVVRSGEVVHEGKLASLKRFKDDVREVVSGLECGIAIDGFTDIRPEDTLEFFTVEEIKRTL